MKLEPVAWVRIIQDTPTLVWSTRGRPDEHTPLYAIPEGYVLLPKEPTSEIVDWVMNLCNTQDEGFARSVYYGIYEAAKPRGDDEYI